MRNSAIARLAVMGCLTLALLVPLVMVQSIVSERATRREAAVQEMTATWGAPQTFGGAVLSIPYTSTWIDPAGRPQRSRQRVHHLPTQLQVEGNVFPERRRRGIFDVVVYRTELVVRGRLSRPDLGFLKVEPESIEWERAMLSVGISDPRALTKRGVLDWNGRAVAFSGGIIDVGLFTSGIQASVPDLAAALAGTDMPFSFTVEMNGTRDVKFLPSAAETSIGLTSSWPHPSFTGTPLPHSRATGDAGFSAAWTVMDFGRPYPQRWTSAEVEREPLVSRAEASAFGVSLLQPVDIYQQAERAVKYAVLFIVLTFLVFFLWEVFHAVLLHPVQYTFVGFALCLFYLLLVSISEHTGFDTAYAVSAAAATLLIGGYSRAVLRGTRQAVSVVVSLSTLYGFLYLLLRLEDYALVAGAIGIFAILAAVMFVTRRMDWYNLRLGGTESVPVREAPSRGPSPP